jgi:DNA repair exonuclease SbcCD ATPase subunit
MELDAEKTELLERRLAERVEERVRSRLFAFYSSVGGAIMLVIGFFGYDVVQSTRQGARTLAAEAVQEASKSAQDAVAPTVEKAEAAVAVATKQAADAAAMLDVLTDWMGQRTQKLADIEDKVQTTMQDVENLSGQLRQRLEAFSGQIQSAEETLNDQRERASEFFAGQGDLKQLANQLVKLSEEVKSLDTRFTSALDILPAAGPEDPDAPPVEVQSATQTALQTIIDDSGSIVVVDENAQAATVYIQFAGVEREVAAALSAALAKQNFTLPNEERTGVAAGMHEIRFFFEGDRAAAHRLVTIVNDWLKANGYQANVMVRDSTDFGKAKPKPGVLELWLEPTPT